MSFEDDVRQIIREELQSFAVQLRGEAAPQTEYLTSREAAKLLRMKPVAVRELVKRKLLKRYGTSERILLSRVEVMDLVRNPPVKKRAKKGRPATAESEAARLLESI